MRMMRKFVLFLLSSTAARAALRGEKFGNSPCHDAKNKDDCYVTSDDDGSPCSWCVCKAIPSECLSQEESKIVPQGVFDCSSPGDIESREAGSVAVVKPLKYHERIKLVGEPVDDDFCDVSSKAGYLSVQGSKYDENGEHKHLFYWQFDKRGSSATEAADPSIPFVVWLTGGPGCSSSLALLTENGPCKVKKNGEETELNPYSWTEAAHVLWLDQPAGVGFSYGSEEDSNEEMISEDAYWFLVKFMQKYPMYADCPLYIVGESYGGHYAPAIAHRIWKGNQDIVDGAIELNLAGLGIGNGLTNPEEQYKWYPEMAFNNSHGIKAVGESVYETMKEAVPRCVSLIKSCNGGDSAMNKFACQSAFLVCNMALNTPYQATGLNPYDIREPCGAFPLCYDFRSEEKFMNARTTTSALHVDKTKSSRWESCNMSINLKFHVDFMKDFSHYVADLLDAGIPALMYAGDCDYICNYLGNKAWTHALKWTGGDDFRAAEEHDWKGKGMARTAQGFTFLQVYDAGHMVPSDQPEVALDMITTFLTGGEF